MKDSHKIVLSSIIAGSSLWIIDGIIDTYIFLSRPFLDALIFNIPAHELYMRIFLTGSFIAFGAFTAAMVARKKKLEEQILQAKNDWENVFDSITDAITIHDKDFNVIRANKSAEKLLGFPFVDIINKKKCHELFHGTATVPEGCPSCKTFKTGMPSVSEVFEPHLNRFIEIRAIPRFSKDNQLTGLIHAVRDITGLKNAEKILQESENSYRTLAENLPAIVYRLFLKEKQMQFFNSMFYPMTGYKTEELTSGKICFIENLIAQEDRDRVIDTLTQTLPEGRPFEIEYRLRHKEGDIRHFLEVGRPMLDIDGEPCCIDGVIFDITERKLIEEELKKYQERLEELVKERTAELRRVNEQLQMEIKERMLANAEAFRAGHLASLGELAAGVAHEINNPVNGIINLSQILANESRQGSKENDIANRIIKESHRIAIIVSGLLSFARVSKEKKGPVRIHEIMSDSLSLFGAQLQKDGIKLTINLPQDLPEIIAHPQQIEQVFLNILSNARYALNQKYAGAYNDKILEILGEKIMLDNSHYIRIIFYDRGIGIPSDMLDKVMNPFFSTKPGNVGTGLGLSISHGIISDHGGRIMIESVEGEFTRVIIDLPVAMSKVL